MADIFKTSSESGSYIVYNDEHVDMEEYCSEKGHYKGMLAFDKASDSALFHLNSTPRFPANGEVTFPADEEIYS